MQLPVFDNYLLTYTERRNPCHIQRKTQLQIDLNETYSNTQKKLIFLFCCPCSSCTDKTTCHHGLTCFAGGLCFHVKNRCENNSSGAIKTNTIR